MNDPSVRGSAGGVGFGFDGSTGTDGFDGSTGTDGFSGNQRRFESASPSRNPRLAPSPHASRRRRALARDKVARGLSLRAPDRRHALERRTQHRLSLRVIFRVLRMRRGPQLVPVPLLSRIALADDVDPVSTTDRRSSIAVAR